MHLIWKRPDGFHNATPDDYHVVDLGASFRLWLHKSDRDQYPFRVAGGWEEREATIRLNNLVNLALAGVDDWVTKLNHDYDHSMADDRNKYFANLLNWIDELHKGAKGDTWEVELLQQAMVFTKGKIESARGKFLEDS
ncbi:MAG: hypothetical protein HRU19_11395 [Pseudobacteriovorax sp.]|nr:hypothetical protein [Pseudobacteriovorax sp.]